MRDLPVAEKNPLLQGAILFAGDVNNLNDLKHCMEGCDTVISVHGMKPPRLRKWRDFFPGQADKDLSHPINLNYRAIRKILMQMHLSNSKKFVRLTGSLVGRNPFHPFVFLFNFVLSSVIAWNEYAEMSIRDAARMLNIDYTILRVPAITNDPSLGSLPEEASAGKSLEYFPADDLQTSLPARRKISYQDVAELCLLSAMEPKLSNTTILAHWNEKKDGEKYWPEVIAHKQVRCDPITFE